MPFKPYTLPLSDQPDVRIFFHGQLLMRAEGDGSSCEVGVNPLATDHVLSVEVRTKQVGKPDLINLRLFGPFNFRQPGMTIAVSSPAGPVGAYKCVGSTAPDPVTGTGGLEEDFRWILNLESNLFHGKPLNSSVFNSQHTIKLQDAQYYFETANRADARLEFERTGGGKDPLTLRRIGAIARASVFLAGTQSLLVKWNDGSGKEHILPLQKATDITYEIYIENTPLFVEADLQHPEQFEELVHYYRVIPSVASNERFSLTPKPAGTATGQEGSPTIPCQVMQLDGP